MEALTKFINGHGDAQGGAIISNDLETMDRIRYEAQVNVGAVISPFNAWQIFRGSVTYPLRMKRINDTSLQIARWLETRHGVTFVSYPGLESNSGHELAKRQMPGGFGGVISFGVDADDKTTEQFCAKLKIDRKTPLLAFANARGCSIADLDMQLAFLCDELEMKFPGVLSTLKNAKSVREASDYVLFNFEAPLDQSEAVQAQRAANGSVYYSRYGQ